MKFALLGDSPRLDPLLDAIRSSPEHELALAWLPALTPERMARLGAARWVSSVDEILAATGIDGTIVVGASREILETARRLAAEGQPLLIDVSEEQGAEFCYELSLIRDEAKTPLARLDLRSRHPAMEAWLAEHRQCVPQPGQIVALERSHAEPRGVPIPALQQQLLEDLGFVAECFGEFAQVTALRSGGDEGLVMRQNVVLTGPKQPELHWRHAPAVATAPVWALTLEGGDRELRVSQLADGVMTLIRGDATLSYPAEAWQQAAQRQLADFCQVVSTPTATHWRTVVEMHDAQDAIRRSLARRRTIDLQFENISERSQFKSQMTAMGCGVLLLTPVLFVAYLVVASSISLPPTLLYLLRATIFAPLFVFLAAQLLILLTPTPNANR